VYSSGAVALLCIGVAFKSLHVDGWLCTISRTLGLVRAVHGVWRESVERCIRCDVSVNRLVPTLQLHGDVRPLTPTSTRHGVSTPINTGPASERLRQCCVTKAQNGQGQIVYM
jgi:hypothetical protein